MARRLAPPARGGSARPAAHLLRLALVEAAKRDLGVGVGVGVDVARAILAEGQPGLVLRLHDDSHAQAGGADEGGGVGQHAVLAERPELIEKRQHAVPVLAPLAELLPRHGVDQLLEEDRVNRPHPAQVRGLGAEVDRHPVRPK